MATQMGKDLNIYGDSQLFINQLLKEYEVQKEDLVPYHSHALWLLGRLDIVKLEHVPRSANKMADTLASLAATSALGQKRVCLSWCVATRLSCLMMTIQRKMSMQFVLLRQMKKTGTSRSWST